VVNQPSSSTPAPRRINYVEDEILVLEFMGEF